MRPPDQLQDTFVFDVFGQPGHQPIVVDGIEVLLQVKVHHPGLAAFYKTLRLPQGIVRAASRAKAEAGRRELRLVDTHQYLRDGLRIRSSTCKSSVSIIPGQAAIFANNSVCHHHHNNDTGV